MQKFYAVVGTILSLALFFGILIWGSLNRPPTKDAPQLSSLNKKDYKDSVCGFSFNHPSNWKKSNIMLPLPQKPLSQIVFDEPGKNSIFYYICYDSSKYSFEQFIDGGGLGQRTESLSTSQINWTRAGNFVHTTKNGKLIILQMFFTKYDLHPQDLYEKTFLNIIQSFN